ncbi:mitochondrial glycoprotein [Dunaliella salina]|uniref:Mitochondrial glycoprotein n=1 Tax=Dunaliella salina TaxID=3046 RepID=A0ABQ7FU71_DUNSA|nr:mitochondrial glycoprotein [Dunaliella salina]|eukprot:KAF5825596.1 mitochondrial glycoprotein [Dunaliella salina]
MLCTQCSMYWTCLREQGPVYDELDEGLQREFQMYIDDRGITPALGEYLRHLIHDKEEREYIAWLDNVKKFVEK